jgi:hypothetical protein
LKVDTLKVIVNKTRFERLKKVSKCEPFASEFPCANKDATSVFIAFEYPSEAGLMRKYKFSIKQVYSLSSKNVRVLKDVLRW